MECTNKVTMFSGRETICGSSNSIDGTLLCVTHLRAAKRAYPQGWRHYPGDVCKHGTYVGGCGVDWMCGPCEMGED